MTGSATRLPGKQREARDGEKRYRVQKSVPRIFVPPRRRREVSGIGGVAEGEGRPVFRRAQKYV
jgi:hypothetical protein